VNGIVHGASRTRKVEDIVSRSAIKRLVNINLAEFEMRLVPQMIKVGEPAGKKVIHGYDRIAFSQEGVTKMRTEKPGTAGHDGALFIHGKLTFFPATVALVSAESGDAAGRPTL
jgi:hypothetical protein